MTKRLKNIRMVPVLAVIFMCSALLFVFNIDWGRSENYKSFRHKCVKEELVISPQLAYCFECFVKDAKINGYKYDHAYCLDWIRLSHSHSIQGETVFCAWDEEMSGTIKINKHLLNDTIGLRLVLYHELGHWLGLEHGSGIMAPEYSSRDSSWARKNWDELVKKHFEKLKRL